MVPLSFSPLQGNSSDVVTLKGRNQPAAQRKTPERPLLMSVHDPVQRKQWFLEAGKVGFAVCVSSGLGLGWIQLGERG